MASYTPDQIDALIANSASHYNIDQNVFRRMLHTESGLDPNIVNRKSGAAGIAQFMPGTARMFGIDPMDPGQAIPAAAHYLRMNLNQFDGSYAHALAAYNWGPGNVQKNGVGAAPPETQQYVASITGNGPIPRAGPGGGGGTRYNPADATGQVGVDDATPMTQGNVAPFQFASGPAPADPAAQNPQQEEAPISDIFIVGTRKPKKTSTA